MAKALWLRRCNRHWRVAAAVARRMGAGVSFSRVGVRGSQAAVPKMMRRSSAGIGSPHLVGDRLVLQLDDKSRWFNSHLIRLDIFFSAS